MALPFTKAIIYRKKTAKRTPKYNKKYKK